MLLAAMLAMPIGRAMGQDIPEGQGGTNLPDSTPGQGVRIMGPLLGSRPPSQYPIPAPPPTLTPGPFQSDVPGAGQPPIGDAASDGPEPINSRPLLTIPPTPPPLPAMVPGEGTLPDSAFGQSRSTQIRNPGGAFGGAYKTFSDSVLWGDESFQYLTLPHDLLWQVPLANPREPRFSGKFFNIKGKSYIDTAIGGQFGLGRFAPKNNPNEGIQLDLFAAVFTRFNPRRFLTAADYRAGIPLTYRKGPWSTKFSYEHTSTHIGDEYSQSYGVRQNPLVLDEFVLGLSRYFGEHVRVYGQAGYAFNTAKETNKNHRDRYDIGVSYSNYADTGPLGKPYGAFDLDIRSYQNYQPNATLQAGWQWVGGGHSVRLGVEIYNGKSSYGQFYKTNENWVAFAGYYDW